VGGDGGAGGSGIVVVRYLLSSYGQYTHTITGGNVKFPSGTVPSLTQGSGSRDVLKFDSDGTNWNYMGGILDAK
jgi:hypothetical protein